MFEEYSPRAVYDLNITSIGDVEFKVYGISHLNTPLSLELINNSLRSIETGLLDAINSEKYSSNLGFIIIHAGEMGVSTLAHWWIQGSVLCQRIHRILYNAHEPIDTRGRPVIACVWELSLINAEQEIWKKTMMADDASPQKYLNTRANLQNA